MDNFEYCRECRRYHDSGKHDGPKYLVWSPDYFSEDQEDGHQVRAARPETAAEKWAELSDQNGDYDIITDGGPVGVCVRDEEGTITKWDIYAEAIPEYRATEQKPCNTDSDDDFDLRTPLGSKQKE